MNFIKRLASWFFALVLTIRHKLFEMNILKSTSFDVPILCVGNIKVGGTGKTPMTDFLISHLKRRFNVAVLSRGYKRKTKGFVLAGDNSTSNQIGDEPMLLHLRHSDVTLAVCESRVEGVRRLLEMDPSINMIILDDAFQHRYIKTSMDILLTEFGDPYHKDNLLPYGHLRDLKSQAERASFIVVTKCPEDIKPIDMRILMHELQLKPYQSIYFTRMVEGDLFPLFDRGYESIEKELIKGDSVVLASAIANPTHLINTIDRDYKLVDKFIFKDHYNYKTADIKRVIEKAVANNAFIIITEKDAPKIKDIDIPSSEKFRFYVSPIEVKFVDSDNLGNDECFIKDLVKSILSKDGKYCLQNKQFNK